MTEATGVPAFSPSLCELTGNEVHVWIASFRLHEGRWREFWRLLSPDEQERAQRFHFERDACRYAVGRGILRLLLGSYAGISPERLEFRYGLYGKPALTPACGGDLIRFNLSHSGDVLMAAVSAGREVGVDVEQIRDLPEADSMAGQFFTPFEYDRYHHLKKQKGLSAFFICWTRREAYVKATGEGLSGRFDETEIVFGESEGEALPDLKKRRWTLMDLDLAEGCAAALCAEGQGWRPVIRCFRL